jgi:hypothetical protein
MLFIQNEKLFCIPLLICRKAKPEFTKSLFDNIDERLVNSGFEVEQTPFGYFLDLKVDAPAYSLARIFKYL